jgi:hypothetical protein
LARDILNKIKNIITFKKRYRSSLRMIRITGLKHYFCQFSLNKIRQRQIQAIKRLRIRDKPVKKGLRRRFYLFKIRL